MGDHLTNAQIARRLFISIRTVESHVSSLLRKLDLTDRRGLADLAASLDETTPIEKARPRPGAAEADEAAAVAADAACPIRYTKRDDLNIAYQITARATLTSCLSQGSSRTSCSTGPNDGTPTSCTASAPSPA